MRIIGIAGGSGSGKSTACYALVDSDPLYEIINLDDYQRFKDEANLPILAGMINWDHPDIIRWDDLINDLEKLRAGKKITFESWAHRSNPHYASNGRMILRTVAPKPIILVEGYLALHNPLLNKLYDKKIYLDLDAKTRAARRDKNSLVGGKDYETKVLQPMFTKFVEPTKKNADIILDVSGMTNDQIAKKISDCIAPD